MKDKILACCNLDSLVLLVAAIWLAGVLALIVT